MHKPNKILVPSRYFPGYSYGAFAQAAVPGELIYEEAEFLSRPADFKLVVFTGGEDVTPEFYGETSPRGDCHNNIQRDLLEKKIFETADRLRIPMFGICRGAQFLNVMLGGKMMHHIDGHGGRYHEITFSNTNIVPSTTHVNSLHHQMIVPTLYTNILAWSTKRLSKIYIGDGDKPIDFHGPEVEAIYSPTYNVLGMQWHPEIMKKEEQGYAMSLNILADFANMEVGGFTNKYIPATTKAFMPIKRGI